MKKLNLGCGINIKKGYVNVDITKFNGVDKTFDFDVFPYPFEDSEFDEIYCDNVLEHLKNVSLVMKELHRITKSEGVIKIIVPYYNCYGAYNDITHKHYFSHLAFEPFYKKNSRGNYFIKEEFYLRGQADFVNVDVVAQDKKFIEKSQEQMAENTIKIIAFYYLESVINELHIKHGIQVRGKN